MFQFSSTLLLKILSLAAARSMHNGMLKALLRSEIPSLVIKCVGGWEFGVLGGGWGRRGVGRLGGEGSLEVYRGDLWLGW